MKKEKIIFTIEKKKHIRKQKNNKHTKIPLHALKQDNQNADYYAVQLGCKIPTIKKYIKAIRNSYDSAENTGFDITYNKTEKRYELSTCIKFPAFSPEEIEALHMAARYLSRQEGTPFKHLIKIEEKLKKYFTKEIKEKIKKKIEYSGPEIKVN